MELFSCQLIAEEKWPDLNHPLHLLTDKVKWMSKFGECDSPTIIALSKSRQHKKTPSLFVVLHLDYCPNVADQVQMNSSNAKDSSKEIPIGFKCSNRFIEHYQLESSLDNLLFACVTTFALDRVVVLAKSEETFEWAKDQRFETGLLVASTFNRSLLVRCNDTFLSPPISGYGGDYKDTIQKFNDMLVVQCSPLQQGTINMNTEVVVVKSTNNAIANMDQGDLNASGDGEFHVKICDFLPIQSRQPFKSTRTNLSTVYCSETAVRKLKVIEGNFISVCLKGPALYKADPDRAKESMCRLFKLQTVDDELFYGHMTAKNEEKSLRELCLPYRQTVVLSSLSWFNFIGNERFRMTDQSDCLVEIGNYVMSDPLRAHELHLSLVISPEYSSTSCYDNLLLPIFHETQLLRAGDIISIDVEGNYDFYDAADVHSHRCAAVHFQVMGFEKGFKEEQVYLVDTKYTSIYQDGRTNSYVPMSLDSHQLPLLTNTLHHSSTGLSKYIDDLTNTISTYLTQNGQLGHVCSVLLSGQPGSGKRSVISEACGRCAIHLVEIECHSLSSDTPGASEAKIYEAFRREVQSSSCGRGMRHLLLSRYATPIIAASLFTPCAIVLRGVNDIGASTEASRVGNRVISALCKSINGLPTCEEGNLPAVVIATTNNEANVATDLRMLFLHQINIDCPEEDERLSMLLHVSRHLHVSRDLDYLWLAKHTAGFVFGDIWELMRKALQFSRERIIAKCAVGTKLTWMEEECLSMAGVKSSTEDLLEALHCMQLDRADNIGVPKIPNVEWRDIGGLENVKAHILDTIQLPLDHPELVSTGLRRSGVLLYGPPGTGKTLLAKAVASQCSLSFLSVKGPELINMYVGQSEANVRSVFQRARDAAPCVVFFDELDALAPNRGKSGDSGGVMDRVVSQLLAELDGVNESHHQDKQVFIIAASNRPDLIDEALLRPGRLDKLLYVGVSESRQDRNKVLQSQTRKLNLSPNVDLEKVVDACPMNMTGADFHGLTNVAAINAVRRKIRQIEGGHVKSEACVIEQCDFMEAARTVIPSIDSKQLDNYKRVKAEMAR